MESQACPVTRGLVWIPCARVGGSGARWPSGPRRSQERGHAVALGLAGLAGLGLAPEAHAQDAVSDEPGLLIGSSSAEPSRFAMGRDFTNKDVTAVLGESENQVLWFEFGRLFPKKLQQPDLTVGIGRLRELGKL